ncbi:arginase [Fusarium mundagurra]|uniref:Arginase n=1 Tax=Fusarium mundagurra TaxID=1567541 RepID=A0A8H5YZB3_9HYPO|nr:arginase [Fusarium mundagurra]
MPLTSITIIIAPYHVGLYDHRVRWGPLRIMSHGIDKELSKLAPVSFINVAPVDEFEGEIGRAFEIFRCISNAVSKAVSNNLFPLVLSGNCYAKHGDNGWPQPSKTCLTHCQDWSVMARCPRRP